MSRASLLALAALLLGAPACGGGSSETGTAAATAPTATDGGSDVRTAVEVKVYPPTLGGGARRFELACDPPRGTHPRPKAACDVLEANADALRPVPADVACTQEFGGDDRAEVRGTVDGEKVQAELNRRNGCEIARWDRLAPLLNVQ